MAMCRASFLGGRVGLAESGSHPSSSGPGSKRLYELMLALTAMDTSAFSSLQWGYLLPHLEHCNVSGGSPDNPRERLQMFLF